MILTGTERKDITQAPALLASFSDDVQNIADLKEGITPESTASNVAGFGALVDLGIRQDPRVHVSPLSNKFVQDAREVLKTGQIVKVKARKVNVPRKRTSPNMKLNTPACKRKALGRI